MKINIRLATIHNLKAIQKLNLMLFKKENKEFDNTLNCKWTFSKDGEDYFKKRLTKNDSCVLAAYVNDKIVGYLAGGLNKKSSTRVLSKFARLESMFVLDEFRGQGIGTKLFQAFADWCRSKGVGRLRVVAYPQNKKGINFYKKNGFVDYDLILEKDLPAVRSKF